MKIKYLGKEIVNSDLGKINCLKFCPVIQKGRVFKREEDLTLWVSDDMNHVPIRLQGEILFGSIKMDISAVAGLVGTLNFAK